MAEPELTEKQKRARARFKDVDLKFRKTVDPNKRRTMNVNLLELGVLKEEYNKCSAQADQDKKGLEMERGRMVEIVGAVEDAQNRLAEAQEEIDMDYLPEGAQPRARIASRDKIFLEVNQLEAALSAQRAVVQKANVRSMGSDKKSFEADRAINRFAETCKDAQIAMSTIGELDKIKEEKEQKIRDDIKARKIAEMKAIKEAKEAQEREMKELEAKRAKINKKLNSEARKTLGKSVAKTIATTSQIMDLHEKDHDVRTEAVLELHTNQNAVFAAVATNADKERKRIAAAKKKLEDEKDDYLSRGLNPYVEFRKQELDAEAVNREKRMRASVEKKKRELAERFQKQEQLLAKQNQAKKHEREADIRHRDSIGRWVGEEKNREYIIAKTSNSMEVLDPSGRASRVDPSQITDIPDYTFGLGKSAKIPAESMKRITEKIREELKVDRDDIGEYKRLVAGLMKKAGVSESDSRGEIKRSQIAGATSSATTNAADEDGDDAMLDMLMKEEEPVQQDMRPLEGLAAMAGAMPGVDMASTLVNYAGSDEKKESLLKIAVEDEGETHDEGNALLSVVKPKYTPVVVSKFERDALNRAKDRARDRVELGTEQIAGGRLFKGHAFIAKPEMLIFKDFEVGRSYKKHFILTNVSYTFNSFKLLALNDDVIDFFVITYDKPGRISAGVSCSLEIVFTPQLNQDIFTHLKLFTETGPIEMPLHCLIKRCAPQIVNSEATINFETMVMGQKSSALMNVTNTEALPSRFTITPIRDEEEVEEGNEDGEGVNSASVEEKAVELSGDADIDPTAETTADPYRPSSKNSSRPSSKNNSRRESIASATSETSQVAGLDNTPAQDEMELSMRVQRVVTDVVRRKKRENPYPLSSVQQMGYVEGYGSTSVSFVCAPLAVGPIEQQFSVVFDGVTDDYMASGDEDDPAHEPTKHKMVKREQMLTVRCVSEEVPVYVAEEMLDMKACLMDRIYRRKVVLKNRGRAAYRVMVKVPIEQSAFVEVSPTMFFVQARGSQSINVKFTPTAELLQTLGHFTVPCEMYPGSALLTLPVEIQVVNQEIPVYFMLKSQVTPSSLELSSSRLEFGEIYAGQKAIKTLSVRNSSMLPQKVAFVRLRKEFAVSPNDGFGVILPNETVDYEISFSPTSALNYEVDLMLMTSFNDMYTVKVVAEGVEAPLELSASVMHMRVTAPGQRVIESTLVTNKTKHSQCFEVMSPDKRFSWITVSPAVMNLGPGKSGRLEVEFHPPSELQKVDPNQWHTDQVRAVGEEKAGEGGAESSNASVFDSWTEKFDWIYGKGMFGDIRWTKPLSLMEEVSEKEDKIRDDTAAEAEATLPGMSPGSHDQLETSTSVDEVEKPLPSDEWGVSGSWNLPILLKPRRSKTTVSSTGTVNSVSSATVASTVSDKAPLPPVYPLYIGVQTSVTLPQIEADVDVIDFGQISVGIRQLKSFKIFNKTYMPLKLKSVGINAVGPFTLVRPIKEIGARESMTVIVECFPEVPGLMVEVLEISAIDENSMGHRIRVTIRVQGLKPSICLDQLDPPPPNWSTQCGILDFGNCLMLENVTKKFVIKNKSTFEIDAKIVRVVGAGLSPLQQSQLVERTATGLPVFSIRPERVRIPMGASETIEVTFRPDRGRFQPFREDVDIIIGKTDETYRVGVFGRSWARQMFVIPAAAADEAFPNVATKDTSTVEDTLVAQSQSDIRDLALASRDTFKLKYPDYPRLTLEFPDPYAEGADPSSYTTNPAPAPPTGKDAGSKAPPGVETRQQVKKLQLCSARCTDNRPGLGSGTYEIILGAEAVASGLWTLSADKGSISTSTNASCDVVCNLPKPRSLGGLFVGSWKSFQAVVVLKGGWAISGESDECKVPIILKAFVCL